MKKTRWVLALLISVFLIHAKHIKLNFGTGLTITKGNSDTVRINSKAAISIEKGKSTFNFTGNFLYGKAKEVVDTNKGKILISVNKQIKSSLHFHSLASYEYDRLADIKARINFGLGLQMRFLKRDKDEIYMSTSYVSEFEDYYEKIIPKRSNRLLVSFFIKKTFWENSVFITKAEYIPNIENLSRDYRIEAESSLKVLMKRPLWLSITFNNKYNNMPVSEKLKKNDFTLITSLEILI